MNCITFLSIAAWFSATMFATAQQPSPTVPGPWDNDVIVHRIAEGGPPEKLDTFERAGVPTVARLKDGRLIAAHQHFPENDRENFDKIAVHFSSDEGKTWTASKVITVSGLPDKMRFPFDPTLVPLPDGRIRLYFTGNYRRDFGGSTPAIHSAISSDGITYTYEPGVRFGVDGRAVIDCAVAIHKGVFHLFAPDNGSGPDPGRHRGNAAAQDSPREGTGYHATSVEGLRFTRVEDVTTAGNQRWLGNVQSDGTRLIFFGTGGGPWPLTSSDGIKWQADPVAIRIPGADPGAVKLKDGSWLLVVTGAPRPGSATANTRRQPDGGTPHQNPDPGGFRPMLPPIMIAIDVNHDGTIDAAEIANSPAAMKTLDRNGDGQLTPEEFRPDPEQHGRPAPE